MLIGPDQEVCASSPAATLNGSITGGITTGTWSGGAGSFSPGPNALNAVYTPSTAEISAGTVTLTLTSNDPPGACTPASDYVIITITPLPDVNPGGPYTICSNESVTLNGSVTGTVSTGEWLGGGGIFVPGRNALNATYTPTASEIAARTVTLTLRSADPSGSCGPVSESVTITIRRAVTITTQPSNVGVCASFPADISVVATGDNLTYQWYRGTPPLDPADVPVVNSSNISGATSNILHFNQASLADAGSYYVIVSGAAECDPVPSIDVTLNVDQAIVITDEPVSRTLCVGSPVTFSVEADANGDPLLYQWRFNGTIIPGANSPAYTIDNISATNAGNYDVLISGSSGYNCSSAQSAIATLALYPIPVATADPASSEICSGTTTSIDLTSNVPGTIFNWTFTANGVNGVSSGSGSTISQVLTTDGNVRNSGIFSYPNSKWLCWLSHKCDRNCKSYS